MSNTIKLNDLTAIVSPSVNAEFWVYDPEASFPRDRKLTFSNLYNRIKIAINNETPTLNLNITGNSTTVTSGVYLTGTQTITGAKTFTATANFNSVNISQNLTISGDLTVNGTQTILNTETLSVEDNIIEINRGLEGTPPSGLESGILVNRGDSPDYKFIFREIDNTFVIGESGDEQAVATREDNPEENGIAFWNDVDKRFDTSERIIWNGDEYGSELLIDGNVKVTDDLEVTGEATFIGDNTFTGEATFADKVTITDDLDIFGNINIDGVLTKNGEKIFDFFSETVEGSEGHSDWTQDSETDPWIASIIINGIKETDRPIVDIDLSQEDFEDIPEFLSNWSLVYRVKALENEIKIFALEEPEKNFNISIKVIR